MTKILRLTSLAPLFDVDCEIICSVSVGTVWRGFFSLDATLSQGGVGIMGIFQGIFISNYFPQLILCHWSLSIPPENIRRSEFF